MIYRERKHIDKLRRRNAILWIVILLMASWIKNLYDDKSWLLDENRSYFYSNLKKDEQIKKLTLKLDSIVKIDKKSVELKPKIFKKKDIISTKNDTLQVIKPIDTIKVELIERKDSL